MSLLQFLDRRKSLKSIPELKPMLNEIIETVHNQIFGPLAIEEKVELERIDEKLPEISNLQKGRNRNSGRAII